MSALAQVDRLTIRFGDRAVVDGVSLEIGADECLALVGESGSGKTLTARALLGLLPAEAEVSAERLVVGELDGRLADERDWRTIRGREVGLIAQDALVSLDPLRRIGAEVGEALRVHGEPGARRSRRRVLARVQAELQHVAMPDPELRMRQYAHELSGGQRQRALVAAATINRPRLLIADEPTTALDVSVQQQVLGLLERLKREGIGLLLISHDLAVVSRIADRVAVMQSGRIVEQGETRQVLEDPQHEYTRSLLAAEPSLHPRGTRLSSSPRLNFGSAPPIQDPSTPVLAASRLVKSFRRPDGSRLRAVDGVSFELRSGTTLGIVGESGSGKTTLGRILLGLETPEEGTVELGGERWSGIPERRRRERRSLIQSVYQDPLSSFDPRVSVATILHEALALTGADRRRRRARAQELIAQVGLDTSYLGRRPATLSGGQRQRIAIARALARNPRVLICDEAVSALDVSIQAQVLDALSDAQEQLGLAMVFISHDLGVVQHMCDEVLVMHRGIVVERGAAADVFRSPQHSYTRELLAALPSQQLSTPRLQTPRLPTPRRVT